MRTCSKCGCYVPDKWTTCPACGTRIEINKKTIGYNTASKVFPNSSYQVKIYYKDGTTTSNFFEVRELALKRAREIIDQFWYCIKTIEVFDCNTKNFILVLDR